MRGRIVKAIVSVVALAAVFGVSFFGARIGRRVPLPASSEPTAEPEAMEAPEEPKSAAQQISIPGYEVINLKANQTDQEVYFCNPRENPCFFIITISRGDVMLYQSGMMPPGTKVERIKLPQALEAGTYVGVVLRYSCYDLYTQKELNGAEMTVKLEVT